MLTMLRRAGTLLVSHGPLLVAIYMAGLVLRYVAIQGIGYVGALSAVAGALLFPLITISRLVPLVAMLLVLRDGLPELQRVAPRPDDPKGRRVSFLDGLLGSVVAFVVFYSAWGYLREDASAYFFRVLNVTDVLNKVASAEGEESLADRALGELSFGPLTIGIIVVAFALRWAYGRYKTRLPRLAAAGALYLEALWVVWSALLIGDALNAVDGWVQERQAMVWLADLRTWVGEQLVPVAWIWDGVEWLLGEAGGILLLPLAWLAIAGVVYGEAVAPQAARLGGKRADRARARYGKLPQWLRKRLGDFWGQITGRFRPIGNAIVLMWRAGAVLIAGYVLLYTIMLAVQSAFGWAVAHALGPQDMLTFWQPYYVFIIAIVPIVMEPMRSVIVAAAYDRVVGALRPATAAALADPLTEDAGPDEDQGETGSLANSNPASTTGTSTKNGPSASSGTT